MVRRTEMLSAVIPGNRMPAYRATMFFPSILLLACSFCGVSAAGSWTLSVDQRNGLPAFSRGGPVGMSSDFVFWGKNWLWAGLSTEFKVVSPFEYSVNGISQSLNIDLIGQVKRSADRQMTWDYDLNALSNVSNVIGGGIAFRFDLENLGAQLGEPDILPGNRGWSWGHPGVTRLEMRFDPPMASVYFEGGRKSEIRAFFYQGGIPQGQRHYVVTLNVSDDVAIVPTTGERFGLDDYNKWPINVLDWNRSPVDISFLNDPEKPAGKHGFVKAVKGRLEFEDGAPGRFWGTNLTAGALFGTSRDNVRRQARRLSELGFNLVRLHHHDSSWVDPNIFGDRRVGDTRKLSAAMLEKLDWWIKCLKDEGIYVWLDLQAGRQLKAADGIDDFDEIAKGMSSADPRGYNYVNRSIQNAMQQFNEAYLDHRNVFTGLRYMEEPAIMAMLLTNENDVTFHFGNALLPDKNVPKHDALYMAQAKAFAGKFGLSNDKTWRSWEPGPSKLFLNDLEHRFDIEMIGQLRALGVKAQIVTTSFWGNEPLSSLPALTTGDVIDAHSYGGTDELKKSPIYTPTMIDWIAAAHVADRPLTATEWNVETFPAPDRHTIPLYVASSANLQGWDALMQYAYSQVPFADGGPPSNWHSFNDPALLATLPAAALLYRRNDVREAQTTYVFAPTPDQLFNRLISPANSVALRSAAEIGKLIIAMPQTRQLPWLEKSQIPAGAKVITDPDFSIIDKDASEALSDTGELRRNWDLGVYTINTPRTQAAMGWIGGKQIKLADVEIATTTRNATVAVQSLDDKRISESRSILISLGARSVPSAGNQMPFHSEPVAGRLIIRAPEGLKLFAKNRAAETGADRSPGKLAHPQVMVSALDEEEVPASYKNGGYQITLDGKLSGHWLFLR
jgi:hypothetical protein